MSALPSVAVRRRWYQPGLPQPTGLWAHSDFLRLFAAQSVSLFGSEITLIALPLTAVLVLGAGPEQMGMLAAASRLPYLLVGLFAGVWVDRLRCRSVLVAADFECHAGTDGGYGVLPVRPSFRSGRMRRSRP